jgi:hypothetical protein
MYLGRFCAALAEVDGSVSSSGGLIMSVSTLMMLQLKFCGKQEELKNNKQVGNYNARTPSSHQKKKDSHCSSQLTRHQF